MHSIVVMGHITIDLIAKGLQGKLTTKEKNSIREDLIEGSTTLAVEVACSIVEDRTGLPRTVCKPIARQIVKNVRMTIKENMSG